MSEEECAVASVPVCARRCGRAERFDVRAAPNGDGGGPGRTMGAAGRDATSKLQISVYRCP